MVANALLLYGKDVHEASGKVGILANSTSTSVRHNACLLTPFLANVSAADGPALLTNMIAMQRNIEVITSS